jgi:hypothetical protein
MAKGKKKNKQNLSFYRTIKPLIKDNRVLLAILGAVGVGVALASAVGSDKGRTIVDNISKALKDWGQPNELAGPALDEKKGKHPKQFAVE